MKLEQHAKGSGGNGASTDNGMGPRPEKGQPFGGYRLQWSARP